MTDYKRETELALIAAHVMTAHLAEFERLVKTCVTCEYFEDKQETCQLAGYRRPPAKVIAFGCEKYEQRMPF